MITIAWIIRSFQGMLRRDGENFWQDDWFLGIMMTVLTLLVDGMIFVMIGAAIHIFI